MASLVGAVVMLFLAGAHVAGEWSGRTLKTVLTAESRRWRILFAKAASLWIAGVTTLAAMWLLLAGFSFFLVRAWQLPGRPGAAAALRFAGPDLLRAIFVLGTFAILGLCAAIVTRSMLGTVVAGLLVLGLAMELVNISDVTRFPLPTGSTGGCASSRREGLPRIHWRCGTRECPLVFPLPA
jgi:ABC-type transport system involved in multi-copper enzyme maturation permease subunit